MFKLTFKLYAPILSFPTAGSAERHSKHITASDYMIVKDKILGKKLKELSEKWNIDLSGYYQNIQPHTNYRCETDLWYATESGELVIMFKSTKDYTRLKLICPEYMEEFRKRLSVSSLINQAKI